MTALAIPISGIFYYHQIANDALTASAAVEGGKWFVKYFTGYTIGRAFHTTQAKQIQYSLTAEVAEWLYRNREYHKRTYYYGSWSTCNGGKRGPSIGTIDTAS